MSGESEASSIPSFSPSRSPINGYKTCNDDKHGISSDNDRDNGRGNSPLSSHLTHDSNTKTTTTAATISIVDDNDKKKSNRLTKGTPKISRHAQKPQWQMNREKKYRQGREISDLISSGQKTEDELSVQEKLAYDYVMNNRTRLKINHAKRRSIIQNAPNSEEALAMKKKHAVCNANWRKRNIETIREKDRNRKRMKRMKNKQETKKTNDSSTVTVPVEADTIGNHHPNGSGERVRVRARVVLQESDGRGCNHHSIIQDKRQQEDCEEEDKERQDLHQNEDKMIQNTSSDNDSNRLSQQYGCGFIDFALDSDSSFLPSKDNEEKDDSLVQKVTSAKHKQGEPTSQGYDALRSNIPPTTRKVGYIDSSTEHHAQRALGSTIVNRLKRKKDKVKEELAKKRECAVKKIRTFLRMKAEDFVLDRILADLQLSKKSREIMDELDAFHASLVLRFLIPKVRDAKVWTSKEFTFTDEEGEERFDIGWERTGPGFDDWKRDFIPAEIVEVTDGVVIKRIRKDAFLGQNSGIADFGGDALLAVPMDDEVIQISSDDAQQLMKELGLDIRREGGVSPNPYAAMDWGDTTSDEFLSRFFFHGLGAVLLERQTGESSRPELGPIEIDMDFMRSLRVREDFRPYGAKIFADKDQKITGIYDGYKKQLYKPGDEGWEGAKFVAKCSGSILVTARDHLFITHMLVSNYVSLAKIKHLNPSHPIRRLLNVFTFRTNAANDGAFTSLIPKNSILHHGTGFEFDGLRGVFKHSLETSNAFEPFPKRSMIPELLDMSDSGKLPYHSEAVEYYNIVEEFVKSWLKEAGDAATDEQAQAFYSEIRDSTLDQRYILPEYKGVSSMVDVLTQGIFMVTAYHEIAGYVIDFSKDIETSALRIVEDDEGDVVLSADVQAFLYANIMTAATGLEMPELMGSYDNYFSKNGAPSWEEKEWKFFMEALDKQSKKIKKDIANRERMETPSFFTLILHSSSRLFQYK